MGRCVAIGAIAISAAFPAAASATVFDVQNERGTPQASVFRINGGPAMLGSTSGQTDIPVSAGDTVAFTRSLGGCPPPEGAGVEYVVPSPPPAEASVTLPLTTGGSYQPESNDAERWIVGQVNRRRAERGLPPVTISGSLTRAADAVARDSALKATVSGSYPFPPPFCSAIPIDWGFPTMSFASVDAPGTDARAAFAHWSDGSARETFATLGDWDAIGVGDGGGAFIAYFARCQPAFLTQCEFSGDRGDPDIVLPTAEGPAGGGAPAAGQPPAGQPGGGGSGSPAPATTTKPAAGTMRTTGGARARVGRSRTFPSSVTASCAASSGCYVAAGATAAPRRGGRSAARRTLARGGFALADSRSRAVTLTLNAAGRAALRRAKRLRVVVTVSVKSPGFAAAVKRRTLTLTSARR